MEFVAFTGCALVSTFHRNTGCMTAIGNKLDTRNFTGQSKVKGLFADARYLFHNSRKQNGKSHA